MAIIAQAGTLHKYLQGQSNSGHASRCLGQVRWRQKPRRFTEDQRWEQALSWEYRSQLIKTQGWHLHPDGLVATLVPGCLLADGSTLLARLAATLDMAAAVLGSAASFAATTEDAGSVAMDFAWAAACLWHSGISQSVHVTHEQLLSKSMSDQETCKTRQMWQDAQHGPECAALW